jgi:hypothetical protein
VNGMTEAQYHERAEYCLSMAVSCGSEQLREGWLRAAQQWLELATQLHPSSAEDRFEALISARGTGQRGSGSSH